MIFWLNPPIQKCGGKRTRGIRKTRVEGETPRRQLIKVYLSYIISDNIERILKIFQMGQQQSLSQEQMLVTKPGIIIPKSTREALTDQKIGYIYLGNGRWKAYEVGLYAPFIFQWHITKGLVVDSNHEPFIFTQIIDIRFDKMMELSLRENNIESIQILCRLECPNLQRLFFCQNNITSIRSLRRVYSPNLVYLSFNGNQTLETINFAYLDSDYLQELFIHLKEGSFLSLNYVAKLKSKHFLKIWLGKYNQEKQKKSFSVLKKKYKKIQMNEFSSIQCTR